MKRLACAAMALVLGLCLAACAGAVPVADVVMIPGAGGVDDRSFNESAWDAVRVFSGMRGIRCNYIEPSSQTDDSRMAAVRKAVNGGAKIVVLPGSEFTGLALSAGEKYPDIRFLLVDGGADVALAPNTAAIGFASEEAGYMAGYAAVADGCTKLGFLGGEAVEGVVDYGFGFAAGANDAARAYRKTIDMRYVYTGTFQENSAVQKLAGDWYRDGTEVIFAAAGGANASVFAAAEANGGKAIGVDRDQSKDSPTVITSALKGVGEAVGRALDLFFEDAFPAGEAVRYGAAQGAAGLAMDTARFARFTQLDYDALRNRVIAGDVDIPRFSGLPATGTASGASGEAGENATVEPDETKLDKIPGFEYLGVQHLG